MRKMERGGNMKMLYCPMCEDIQKLTFTIRYCECGESWGFYNKDGVKACIGGSAKLIGMGNGDLWLVLRDIKPAASIWWYHSSWWSERMTENVYYIKKEEDFDYAIFEKPPK